MAFLNDNSQVPIGLGPLLSDPCRFLTFCTLVCWSLPRSVESPFLSSWSLKWIHPIALSAAEGQCHCLLALSRTWVKRWLHKTFSWHSHYKAQQAGGRALSWNIAEQASTWVVPLLLLSLEIVGVFSNTPDTVLWMDSLLRITKYLQTSIQSHQLHCGPD
jgi:hypothetical protein